MDIKSEKQISSNRKRNTSMLTTSILDSYMQDLQPQPLSPASSSTSQTTGDTTFEPSIDMIVNDFDDEQTLTEEEALAELEAQDPADEIATLQKESEMPLEQLLAHYNQCIDQNYHHKRQKGKKSKRKKSRKSSSSSSKRQYHNSSTTTATSTTSLSTTSSSATSSSATTAGNSSPFASVDEVIVIEESDEEEIELLKAEKIDEDDVQEDGRQSSECFAEDEIGDDEFGDFGDDDVDDLDAEPDFSNCAMEFSSRRSHLLELYPEKFANVNSKLDGDLSEDDDEDDDLDYVKKTIMVGSAYQATIPVGLSMYGDVLPYENEDKLIWEPSQVSEQEVEDYLMRAREIKSLTATSPISQEEEIPSSSASVTSESDQGIGSNVIKDDEQALHLLVQCGYNFKEALRRKRLNAVPLTGSMSLWSEEECRNFEEGIQKFGKDFRKIRETQVRTRSIRELIQFYYLWKKTDRRDQDFVDSDTIDHMDIYLDFDERDTGSNGVTKHVSSSLATSDSLVTNQTTSLGGKKQHHHHHHHHHAATSSTINSFSIMNENKRLTACNNSNSNPSKKYSSNKKSNSSLSTDKSCGSSHHATAYRRRSSLLSANKTHNRNATSGNYTTKCTLDSSSQTPSGKGWRNNTSTTYNIITSTTGNHCNKK